MISHQHAFCASITDTTARLESTGAPGAVHLSKETAGLLIRAGKGAWIEARKDTVEAKGKGKLQTFWLKRHFGRSDTQSTGSSDQSSSSASPDVVTEHKASSVYRADKDERTKRLISWNVEILLSLLKQVIAHRNAMIEAEKHGLPLNEVETFGSLKTGQISDCLGEVKEIIALPEYDSAVAALEKDPEKVVLDSRVRDEMRSFVSCIASMYRENAFHNFEHASHVLMSVTVSITGLKIRAIHKLLLYFVLFFRFYRNSCRVLSPPRSWNITLKMLYTITLTVSLRTP